jgi:hypothetical protein
MKDHKMKKYQFKNADFHFREIRGATFKIVSGICRITHGPCHSYFENIVGKSVASVRRGLATAFSIPDYAEAFVGGIIVDPEYRLRAGDSVVFPAIAC